MKTKQTIKELMTSTTWGLGGASTRRAAITLLVMVLAATGAWAEDIETVSYIDAYGNVQTAQAVALDGNETITEEYGRRFIDLAEGWYFVGTDITYSDVTIRPQGNVNLILANDCTMNIGTADSPTGPFVDNGEPIVTELPQGQRGGQQIVAPATSSHKYRFQQQLGGVRNLEGGKLPDGDRVQQLGDKRGSLFHFLRVGTGLDNLCIGANSGLPGR